MALAEGLYLFLKTFEEFHNWEAFHKSILSTYSLKAAGALELSMG